MAKARVEVVQAPVPVMTSFGGTRAKSAAEQVHLPPAAAYPFGHKTH